MPDEQISLTRWWFFREIRKHPIFGMFAVIWSILGALSIVPLFLPPDKAQKFSLYPFLPRWDWHITVIGFLAMLLLMLSESYYHFYRNEAPKQKKLRQDLEEQTRVALENSANYIRRS